MLHVTSGDATAAPLRAAGLPGEVVAAIDPVHEGPAPAGLTPGEWRRLRARFVADAGWASHDAALDRFEREAAALERAAGHDEVVLWFEHDLHCQLTLVRLLDHFATRGAGGPTPSLVCIDSHPAVPRFSGLGQLAPDQLAGLFAGRRPVDAAMLELAVASWAAFRSPDPRAVERLLEGGTNALPFLAPALRRHLEQFPSVAGGVSRTERQALEAVAAGLGDPREIFRESGRREEAPFMGDAVFWLHLRRLGGGPRPLVSIAPDPARLPEATVRPTRAGEGVLAGGVDWIDVAGTDRWLGGVRLAGAREAWRWDPRRGALVEGAA